MDVSSISMLTGGSSMEHHVRRAMGAQGGAGYWLTAVCNGQVSQLRSIMVRGPGNSKDHLILCWNLHEFIPENYHSNGNHQYPDPRK